MLGYRGMIVLGLRHKDVKNITATAVFKGDYFEHGENTEGQWFDYKPCGNKNPEELERVFAVGRLKDTVVIDVMERAEIEQARAKSQMPNGNAWRNHYAEMARKTAVRRLFKYLPMEPVVEAAIAKDEERWSDNTDKPDLDKYRKALAMAEAKRMSLGSMEAVVVSSESDIITEKKGGES
jgi:recombination protein RecT